MKFRKYTKEQLIDAVATSSSFRETLEKLNVANHGGNYRVVKGYIEKLALNTSHFKGQGWNKGNLSGPKRPVTDYLNNSVGISSFHLKNRLLKEKYFDSMCTSCKLVEWLNQPIPLELDHIDGNHYNNALDNLRLLCPNCHALTSTYRGKNISRQLS